MTEKPNLNHEPLRRASRNSRRRGMAVLLVLGLLAITLAVSYAALRTQGTTSNTARNAGRSLDARLAAGDVVSIEETDRETGLKSVLSLAAVAANDRALNVFALFDAESPATPLRSRGRP